MSDALIAAAVLTEDRVREIVRSEIEYALRLTAAKPEPRVPLGMSPAAARKRVRDEAIAADYDAGLTMADCAAKHGVHANTVSSALKRVGMVRPARVPKEPAPRVARAARDAAIAATYQEGNTLEKTANAHGCSVSVVVGALDRLGIPHHNRQKKNPTDDPRLPRFIEMREAGATITEIGAAHNITRERVRQIMARAGIGLSERPLTPEQRAAVEAYVAGTESLGFYAQPLGIGPATFRKMVIRCGHVPRKRGNPLTAKADQCAQRVAHLYGLGRTSKQIAAELGLNHPEEVYRYLARAGVKPQRLRAISKAA